ncbi:MAG TPA: DoxX family protein [Solirubrobacterales bacterium]|nr:DoxX family protein [Solirubrobacterales bacterium]
MTRAQRLLAAFFTFAGTMHFLRPREYEAIVPPQVPMHREVVAISGVAEIVGGLAVLPRRSRTFARWWLLGLLAAVFPANIYMALRPDDVAKRGVAADRIPRWALYARLPLQPLMALWVWRATRRH